jgi:hypothetical protein
MNVYKRPLFMQQGGMARVPVPTPPAAMRPATAPSGAMPPMRPASAPMGAPGAPPRPPAQDVAGIASMVSQKGKMDLDQAQGPEQIINAFRGNQKPLEARYQELAQYVGPQDAAATPLSVLTMVQPSLMMTAKGASESGIGELMANVAGGVNMESAPGQPNRMGQGLGNLMMSRQAPQPAGMAQGGVVGKFAEGGNPLVEYYKQDLPAFQEILAPSQGDKDAAKRQLFFDIAQRGLAMAGGAGGTGNVASQLANVFQTLPGTYAAQQAELRKGERAAQQAALQSASGRLQVQREQQAKAAESAAEASRRQGEAYQKFIYDMTLANNEAMLEAKNKGVGFKGLIAVDTTTNLPIADGGIFNVEDPQDRQRMNTFQAGRQNITFVEVPKLSDLSRTNAAPDMKRVRNPDGTVSNFNVSDSAQYDAYETAINDGGVEIGIEALKPDEIVGPLDVRSITTYTSKLASGEKLEPAEISALSQNISDYLQPTTAYRTNTDTGMPEPYSIRNQLSSPVVENINTAINDGRLPSSFREIISGVTTPATTQSSVTGAGAPPVAAPLGQPTVDQTRAELLGIEVDPEVIQAADMPEQDFLQADFTDIVGSREKVKQVAGAATVPILRLFEGVIPGAGTLANAIEKSNQEAGLTSGLNNLNTGLMTKFQETRTGKAAGDERNEFRKLIPPPYSFFQQPQQFINDYKALYRTFSQQYRDDVNLLNSPSALTDKERTDLIRSINANKTAIDDLRAVIEGAERSFTRYTNEIKVSPQEANRSIQGARDAALGNN